MRSCSSQWRRQRSSSWWWWWRWTAASIILRISLQAELVQSQACAEQQNALRTCFTDERINQDAADDCQTCVTQAADAINSENCFARRSLICGRLRDCRALCGACNDRVDNLIACERFDDCQEDFSFSCCEASQSRLMNCVGNNNLNFQSCTDCLAGAVPSDGSCNDKQTAACNAHESNCQDQCGPCNTQTELFVEDCVNEQGCPAYKCPSANINPDPTAAPIPAPTSDFCRTVPSK